MSSQTTDSYDRIRDASSVYEAVYLAVGAASMCWTPLPSDQVFDSEQAELIGKALLDRINGGMK